MTLDEMSEALLRSQCRKVPHFSRAEAERAAASMNAKPRDAAWPMPSEPFRCPRCGAWHIGRPSFAAEVAAYRQREQAKGV